MLEVGHAVTRTKDDLAVVSDHDCATRDLFFLDVLGYKITCSIRALACKREKETNEKQHALGAFHYDEALMERQIFPVKTFANRHTS